MHRSAQSGCCCASTGSKGRSSAARRSGTAASSAEKSPAGRRQLHVGPTAIWGGGEREGEYNGIRGW